MLPKATNPCFSDGLMNDDDYALMNTILIERPTVGDNKILWLDVIMQHKGVVANIEAIRWRETDVQEQLRWVKGWKNA